MEMNVLLPFLQDFLLSSVRMATPILLAALAELYSERAGLVNIGLDGIMGFGAFAGFYVSLVTGNPVYGILAGAAAGIALNMIYGFFTVTLCAEQIVFGMALNILGPAAASFANKAAFGVSSTLVVAPLMKSFPIPLLSGIPFVGPILFNHTPLVYAAYLLVPLTAAFFAFTKPGLNFKAVGEFPKAAASMGINVRNVKYLAVVICGALAGIAGAYLTTCYISTYSDGVVAGRGFIALSAVIFGRWSGVGVLLASLLFGFTDAFQLRLQVLNPDTPYQLIAMLPYLSTLLALTFFGIRKSGPAANGKPYYREQR